MALKTGARVNGTTTPSPAEDEALLTQLSRLRDVVVAGQHPRFSLPPAVIDQLKASLVAVHTPDAIAEQSTASGHMNGYSFNSNAVSTNHTQQSSTPTLPNHSTLPGLHPPFAAPTNGTFQAALKPASSGGLDPIFLEKSDSLVRAEGRLKRQRIERDLQTQVEQRKPGFDKFAVAEAPPLDVETILILSSARENHVSGLKSTEAVSPASSFDTNDYYSSQVESEWSSSASASKDSDRAADAFTMNLDRHEQQSATSHSKPAAPGKQPEATHSKSQPLQPYSIQLENAYPIDDDEDDEYTPPDAAAFNSSRSAAAPTRTIRIEDDDNSDYEPGEITQDSIVPYYQPQPVAATSPKVPVIRNHLTHIAAPQPNRVSPLAVAKRPSIELELINGRPEVARKGHQYRSNAQSRASTASPMPNSVTVGKRARRMKKRKREQETSATATGRGKRKREKQNPNHSPTFAARQEPYIKDEPVSPPPFANIPESRLYAQRLPQYVPVETDLVSPRHMQPQIVYANELPHSALRHEYASPISSGTVRMASPGPHRYVQKDNQDLRRIASLQYAQRPTSPTQRAYSPAPYRTASVAYGHQTMPQAGQVGVSDLEPVRYQEQPLPGNARYLRAERSRSPPRIQEYQDSYARASSPAMMPPPASAPQPMVVDQYGNRYFAVGPAPVPASVPSSRASVVPMDRREPAEPSSERAPSRMATAYGQPTPGPLYYEQSDARMAPPPKPRRQATEDQSAQYVDASRYRVRDYTGHTEQVRYVEAPTSPTYQQTPRYEPMAPAAPPAREQTSPVYAPMRSHSVRPEDTAQYSLAYSTQQASVAPLRYARPEVPAVPARAMSVAPGYEQAPPSSYARAYSQAPPQIQYVDQYGRPVHAGEVRQAAAPAEYRYQ